jgi:hypothetical protein
MLSVFERSRSPGLKSFACLTSEYQYFLPGAPTFAVTCTITAADGVWPPGTWRFRSEIRERPVEVGSLVSGVTGFGYVVRAMLAVDPPPDTIEAAVTVMFAGA